VGRRGARTKMALMKAKTEDFLCLDSGVIKVRQVVLIYVYNLAGFHFAQVSSSFLNYGVFIKLRKQ